MKRRRKNVIYEEGGLKKRPWSSDVEIGIVVPMPYRAGMSGLTVYLLQDLLNSKEGVWSERFFADTPRSVEWNRPLDDFDVVFVTLQYERDVERANRILGRVKDDAIVIVGGPVAWINPLAVRRADFAYIGEIEVQISGILSALNKKGRESRIEALKSVPGMFYRGKKKKTRLQKVKSMREAWHPYIQVKPDPRHVSLSAYFIEGSRGCSEYCRFCLIGWSSFPRRDRSAEEIASLVRGAFKSKRDIVSLIGAGLGFNPWLEEIVRVIREMGLSVIPPSVNPRIVSEELISLLASGGQRTITLSLESSSRIRRIIGKKIDDDDIIRAISIIKERMKRIRIYTILGLPGEDEEDVRELGHFLAKLKKLAPKLYMEATVSVFVPKPNTPFQWAALIPKNTFLKRLSILRRIAGIPLLPMKWEEALFQLSVDRNMPPKKAQYSLSFEDKIPADLIDTGISKKALWHAYSKLVE